MGIRFRDPSRIRIIQRQNRHRPTSDGQRFAQTWIWWARFARSEFEVEDAGRMGEGRWWGDEMRCGAFCKSSSLPLPFPRNGQISVNEGWKVVYDQLDCLTNAHNVVQFSCSNRLKFLDQNIGWELGYADFWHMNRQDYKSKKSYRQLKQWYGNFQPLMMNTDTATDIGTGKDNGRWQSI